jgi:hypothetical protein
MILKLSLNINYLRKGSEMQEKKIKGKEDDLYMPRVSNRIKEKQYSIISYEVFII